MILLVGNKTDLRERREVRKEEAAAYADQHQLAFIETSALDCSNVDLAFDRIINEIYKVVSQAAPEQEDEGNIHDEVQKPGPLTAKAGVKLTEGTGE